MGSKIGGGNRRGRNKADRFSEINITPMVDVMLVLLIIFMVAAPMMTSGVTVDLPETSSSAISGQDEPLSVSITSDGKIYIQKTPVEAEQLKDKLMAITKEKKDTRIFINGDKGIDYGKVMQIVSEINSAGFTKVALITNPSGTTKSGKR
ncbi:MAG: protein TolR [Rickettsiales bacterium]